MESQFNSRGHIRPELFENLAIPFGRNGDISPCPLGREFQKYWELLSPEEQCMRMDGEGLYSLTVRPLALEIARLLPGDVVLDAFCGIGGNAIAFALNGKFVHAVEIDRERIEMARYNAELAGVSDRIIFHHGDAQDALKSIAADAIFLDPPWGGPAYAAAEKFRFEFFKPNAGTLLLESLSRFSNVGIKLPGNFDFEQLSSVERGRFVVVPNIHNRMLLHYTAVHISDPRV